MDSLYLIMVIKRLNLRNRLCIDRYMASSILACYSCILTPDLPIVVDLLVLKFEIGAIRSKIETPSNPSTLSPPSDRSKFDPAPFVLCPTFLVCLILSDHVRCIFRSQFGFPKRWSTTHIVPRTFQSQLSMIYWYHTFMFIDDICKVNLLIASTYFHLTSYDLIYG